MFSGEITDTGFEVTSDIPGDDSGRAMVVRREMQASAPTASEVIIEGPQMVPLEDIEGEEVMAIGAEGGVAEAEATEVTFTAEAVPQAIHEAVCVASAPEQVQTPKTPAPDEVSRTDTAPAARQSENELPEDKKDDEPKVSPPEENIDEISAETERLSAASSPLPTEQPMLDQGGGGSQGPPETGELPVGGADDGEGDSPEEPDDRASELTADVQEAVDETDDQPIKEGRVDMEQLQGLVESHHVRAERHPDLPLTVYNYSNRPKHEPSEADRPLVDQCRGLILNDEGEVVARPFSRMEEVGPDEELPDEPVEVFEKVDGSLGIQYWDDEGRPRLATRGSFTGPQAKAGSELLEQYADYPFDRDVTYLWEIVDPRYRVTVDYGDAKDITLLGMVETATGRELPLPDQSEVPFPVVKRYDLQSAAEMRATDGANFEGYIARGLESGQRYKVKVPSYEWMNDVQKEVMPARAWRHMVNGGTPETFLEQVPEPAREAVLPIVNDLQAKFDSVKSMLEAARTNPDVELPEKYRPLVEPPAEGQSYDKVIWESLRPGKPDTPAPKEVAPGEVPLPDVVWRQELGRGTASLRVWKYFSQGGNSETLREAVPETERGRVDQLAAELTDKYREIERAVLAAKDAAEVDLPKDWMNVLSLVRKGRPYSKEIWNKIRPRPQPKRKGEQRNG